MMLHYYFNNNFDKTESINNDFHWLIEDYIYVHINNEKDWVVCFIFLIGWHR